MALSFVAAGTAAWTASNNATFAPGLPTGWAADDLHVLIIERNDNTAASSITGWTQIAGLSGNNGTAQRVEVWWRIAVAGDTAPTVTMGTGTTVRGGVILGFRGTSNATPVVNSSLLNVASTATTVSSTNISPSVAPTLGAFVAVMIGARSTTNTAANWSTTFASQQTTLGNDLTIGYTTKAFAASGSYLTPGITWTTNTTTGTGIGLLLAIQGPITATGTAATSQAAQTEAASGALVFSGTAAESQVAQTEAASGTYTEPALAVSWAVLEVPEAVSPDRTGTITTTQAAQTLTADGTYTPLAITGTAAEDQAAQTESASGELLFTGTGTEAQAAQTVAASGAQVFTGTAAESQAAQTASGAGALVFTGTAATAQAGQTESATGAQVFTGTGTESQAAQTESASGDVSGGADFFGDGTTAQAAQTVDASGAVEQIVTGPPLGAALGFAEAIQFGRTLPPPISGSARTRQAPQRGRGAGAVRLRIVPPPPRPISGDVDTRQRRQRAAGTADNSSARWQRPQRLRAAGGQTFAGAVGAVQPMQRMAAAGRIIWEAEDLLELGLVEEAVAQGIDPQEVVRWLLRQRELEGVA